MKQETQYLDVSDLVNISHARLPEFAEATSLQCHVRVFAGEPAVRVLFSDNEGFGLGFSMTQREVLVCRECRILTNQINSKIDVILHELQG